MVSYNVSEVRKCMNELLCKNTFDFFLLQEVTINTFASFHIDGHRLDDFFSDVELENMDERDSLMSYELFRDWCYNIIKGKKAPLSFQMILSLPCRVTEQIAMAQELSVSANDMHLVAIFRFIDGNLTITTGTSMKEFSLDKSLEHAFDKWMFDFLNSVGIVFDKIL